MCLQEEGKDMISRASDLHSSFEIIARNSVFNFKWRSDQVGLAIMFLANDTHWWPRQMS